MSTDVEAPRAARRRSWREFIPKNNTTIAAVLLVVVTIGFAIATNGVLLGGSSLQILAIFAPEMLFMTIAMGFVLLIKEIDLSVGSMYVVSGVMVGAAYRDFGWPLWVCVLFGVAAGALMGLINGLLVVYTGVTSFIVTLGTMWAFRGLMLVALGGGTISAYPKESDEWVFDLIAGHVGGALPAQVLWLLLIVAILVFFRHKTATGSWLQSVGSNDRASRMMGIPTGRVKVLAFTISGLLCGVAGVIQVAHSNQAVPQSGDSVMLTALAGAIVGGVALNGGRGDVLGPLFGGLTLQIISTGLVMRGVIEYWTNVLTAVAIILTAFAFFRLDKLRTRRSK